MSKKTFSIISLGCFRNTYDSEVIAGEFYKQGYKLETNYDKCDILIVNTCGFIDRAKEEALEVINSAVELKKKHKIKKLLIAGCLVERYKQELEGNFSYVDEWRGVHKHKNRFIKRQKLTPSFIDFLKICDGCINHCSYCAIPLIKGPLKSKTKEEILKEVRFIDRQKVKELNIIGQDITSWGKDLSVNAGDLTALLEDILENSKNIRWIRLIYTHPKHITPKLLDLIAKEDRICKYIDLPVQHINDRILGLMNRGVSKQEILSLIGKIRDKMNNCVIRTSIIAGFPTETEKEFQELINFLKEIKFERLGAFVYSREENTAAYDLTQVHHKTKERRFREIMSLQNEIAQEVNRKFLGKELDVLIESKDDDVFIGRSEFDAYDVDGVVYIRNDVVKKEGLGIGDFYRAKIIDTYEYDLVGE